MDEDVAELDRQFRLNRLDLEVLRRLVSVFLRTGRYDVASVRVLESAAGLGREHASGPTLVPECEEMKVLRRLYRDARVELSELASGHGLVIRQVLESGGYVDVERTYLRGAEDTDAYWDQTLEASVLNAVEGRCLLCPSNPRHWVEGGAANLFNYTCPFCRLDTTAIANETCRYDKEGGPLGRLRLWAGSATTLPVFPGTATSLYGRCCKYHLDGRVSIRWRDS